MNKLIFLVLTLVGLVLLGVIRVVENDLNNKPLTKIISIESITNKGYNLSNGFILPFNGTTFFVGDSLDVSYYKGYVMDGWLIYRRDEHKGKGSINY